MGDKQSNFTLYIRNISYETNEDKIREKISPIAEVLDVRIKGKTKSFRKGYAFVEVKSEEDGKKVIDELNNTELDGQTITIEVSKTKPHQSRPRRDSDRRDSRRRDRRDDRRSRGRRDRSPPRRRYNDYYSDDDYYDRRRSRRSYRRDHYDYSDSDDYSRRRRDSPPRKDRRSDRDTRRGDDSASD